MKDSPGTVPAVLADAVVKLEKEEDVPTVSQFTSEITIKEEMDTEPEGAVQLEVKPVDESKEGVETTAADAPAVVDVTSPPRKRRRMDNLEPYSPVKSGTKRGATDSPVKNDSSEGKYTLGMKLEARDLSSNKWYNAKVVEVDVDDREVLIHFDKWSQRYDEWIPMDSSRLRDIQRKYQGKLSDSGYRVGETVMATWTDCRKYPAKVKTILGGDRVEVLFFDGFSKTMKINKIAKFGGDLEIQPAQPPFGATTMTKAERRERNRKILSVAELFHMKKSYKKRKDRNSTETIKLELPEVEPAAVESSSEPTPLPEKDISMSDNEGEKTYINLDASFTQEEPAPETSAKKQAAAAKRPKPLPEGKRRKRTYNRVFLDSSPAGTKREVHPGRGRLTDGNPSDELDNWEPDGDEAYVVESSDGLRRSIIVADDRLPSGWEKHTIQRRSGNSAGKWDVFLVSPTGRRFRSRKEMSSYFSETKELYEPHLYDFTLRGLSHRALKGRAKSSPAQSSAESDSTKTDVVDTPQRKVKMMLPKAGKVKPAETTPAPPIKEAEKLPPPEEGKVYVGQMQVEVDTDGGYVCPKDGCSKHFRKENLLQMHIKHYHPEYNKFMGSTPNVADLAYARTVGEPIEDIVPCGRALDSAFFENISRFEANRKSTPPLSVPPPVPAPTNHKREEAASTAVLEGKKVLRVVLTDAVKHGKEVDVTLPPSVEPITLSSPLRDLLREQPKPGVTAGIKTLLPVVRSTSNSKSGGPSVEWRSGPNKPKMRKRRLSDAYMETLKRRKLAKRAGEGEDPVTPSSSDSATFLTPTAVRQHQHKKLPLLAASLARPPLVPDHFGSRAMEAQLAADQAPEMTQEQLNKRDIINCTCGLTEEDGLMIQCDLCLCWQHGYCNAIESERQVPDKYVCAICLRPARARRSMRHRHDQTWLKEGALPSSAALRSSPPSDIAQRTVEQRTSLLRRSHVLTGALLGVNTALRGLRAKVNVADAADHPKLYLWAKPWSKKTLELSGDEPSDAKQSGDEAKAEASAVEKTGDTSEVEAEVEEKKTEVEDDVKPILPPSITDSLGGTKLLLQALTGGATSSTPSLEEKQLFELPICQSELLRFASSMADNLDRTPAPEPEKPIDPGECRSLLLDHIEHDQRQLMRSLDRLAQQISALEAEDPEPPPQETVEFCPRTKHTIKMLLRDLNTARNIAAV